VGVGTNDLKVQRQGLVEMLDSGTKLMTNSGPVGLRAGQLAYGAGDYGDAAKRLVVVEQIGGLKEDNFALFADAYYKQNQVAAGLAVSQRGLAFAKAAGVPADTALLVRARDAAYRAKMIPETAEWSRQIVVASPSKASWHDMVGFFLNVAKPDEAARIDLFRLLVESKSVVEGREYRELAETLFDAKFPAESKSVLDAGVASGLLAAQNQQVSDLYARIAPQLGPDRASLSQADASSKSSPTGRIASRWADAFLGYGNNAKAIELYRMAIAKGQIDADVVNTRLGIALARSGQKAEASAAFSAVGGTRSEIGRFWKLWVESQP
jgi:tetratricopeptide (TPR) repeat protein